MIKAITPGPVVDLHELLECAQDIATGTLTGDRHLAGLKALAGGTQYTRPGSPSEARQEEVAREHLQHAEEFNCKPGTPEGAEGPMTKEVKLCGSRVPVPVIGAFAEMSSDVETLADVTA